MANVGDSRCVLCRNGIALEMSMDHKPEDEHELNRIHKAGGKVTFEGRVNGGLNLSRALGMLIIIAFLEIVSFFEISTFNPLFFVFDIASQTNY